MFLYRTLENIYTHSPYYAEKPHKAEISTSKKENFKISSKKISLARYVHTFVKKSSKREFFFRTNVIKPCTTRKREREKEFLSGY